MLRWALVFFVIAVIAALFGFTGISAAATQIAQFLFWIFVVLFVATGIIYLVSGRRSAPPPM
ncbi:MAG TPA: DUF1328 domain-containing protein [Dongiaceae bacterium]|jgi:uncharacterized membrane protein YtjA (UPF0391 family)|nr:DUF1328 domain-containing protein [Dongiaceae bacterium]